MSSDLDEIVTVVIYDGSTAISTASFQIPLILDAFTNFPERTRTYNNITDVEVDFSSTDTVHKIATQLFGQSSVLGAVPPSIVVGRKQVNEVDIVPVVADNTAYTVTINTVAYTYTSGTGATATTIAAGLATAIGTPTGVTATATSGVLSVVLTVSGSAWSLKTTSNLTKTYINSTEAWVDALAAVDVDNDSWYCMVASVQTESDQAALSDSINAREKIMGLSTADTVAPTTGTTDIGAVLSAKSAGRTFGVYLPTAATEYPAAAWIGSQLAVTPGSNDWDFKQANGVTVSKLSPTQITNLRAKHYNFYRAKHGVNIFQDGNMFDGKPIDQMKVA